MVTREAIAEAAKRKVASFIGSIDPSDLDTTKRLKFYGVSSLDLVELVTLLMRETKIKVPRTELKKIGTTDELIAVFTEAANLSAAS